MQPSLWTPALRGENFSGKLAERGWYHSFEFPDGERIQGYQSLELQQERFASLPLPADLSGKRVLDVGAWDGWFSFEAERRGAAVTAIDCVEVENFRYAHRKLNSKVTYQVLDFYELPQSGLGLFDYVFFLGVLYHLKHPLLALEILCAHCTDTAVVDSFVIDSANWLENLNQKIPWMEFYETYELGGQLDNWYGPTVGCLMAMCRAAGFARVELGALREDHAQIHCFRKWEPPPETPQAPAPQLTSVRNTRTGGLNFQSRKEEYLSCWFEAARSAVSRPDLRLEIGGFGVPALYAGSDGEHWMANFRLPPGLAAGWHAVRLRFADSDFSNSLQIAVDVPLNAQELTIRSVADGVTWRPNEVDVSQGGFISFWLAGLPENADIANVRAELSGVRLRVLYVGTPDKDGVRQVNAVLPVNAPLGAQRLRICCGSTWAETPLHVR